MLFCAQQHGRPVMPVADICMLGVTATERITDFSPAKF